MRAHEAEVGKAYLFDGRQFKVLEKNDFTVVCLNLVEQKRVMVMPDAEFQEMLLQPEAAKVIDPASLQEPPKEQEPSGEQVLAPPQEPAEQGREPEPPKADAQKSLKPSGKSATKKAGKAAEAKNNRRR